MPVQTPQPSSAFPAAHQNYHLGQCVTDVDDRNRSATCRNYRAAGNGAAHAHDPIGLTTIIENAEAGAILPARNMPGNSGEIV